MVCSLTYNVFVFEKHSHFGHLEPVQECAARSLHSSFCHEKLEASKSFHGAQPIQETEALFVNRDLSPSRILLCILGDNVLENSYLQY